VWSSPSPPFLANVEPVLGWSGNLFLALPICTVSSPSSVALSEYVCVASLTAPFYGTLLLSSGSCGASTLCAGVTSVLSLSLSQERGSDFVLPWRFSVFCRCIGQAERYLLSQQLFLDLCRVFFFRHDLQERIAACLTSRLIDSAR